MHRDFLRYTRASSLIEAERNDIGVEEYLLASRAASANQLRSAPVAINSPDLSVLIVSSSAVVC